MSRKRRRASVKATPVEPKSDAPPIGVATATDPLTVGVGPPWVKVLILAITIGLAFAPGLGGGLMWDDPGHMTKPELQSFDGLLRIWFHPGATQQYYPLLHSAFWVENLLFGPSTVAAHLITLLLHIGITLLIWQLLERLKVPGAYFAALLFGIHPLQVESVAWISETKNTLSGLFYLAAMLCYLRFDRSRSRRWYAVAVGLFVLGLLSKTVIATLPGALLVILWWQRGTLDLKRDVRPVIPLFVLGLVAGKVTSVMEFAGMIDPGSDFALSFAQRCLQAGRAIWFYAGKLAWPADLMLYYPRWVLDPAQAWQWAFPVAVVVVIAVCWLVRRRSRAPLAGVLFFVGTLLPALGFVNVYPFKFSFVADHFQYLAGLGLIVLVAGGVAHLLQRLSSSLRQVGLAACGALVVVLGFLSWKQSHLFGEDDVALYREAFKRNPKAWAAQINWGKALEDRGDSVNALVHYQAALQLRPDLADARFEIAGFYYVWQRYPEAIVEFEEAIRTRPGYAKGRFNFGAALVAVGQRDRAIAQFDTAGYIDADSPVMQDALASVYLYLGDTVRAQLAAARARAMPPPR